MPVNRRELLRTGSLVLLLGAHQIARGATIIAVRVWPAPDYTRLTIESDGQLRTTELLAEVLARNALETDDLISIIFTCGKVALARKRSASKRPCASRVSRTLA
mgnify:CR=1 FL=1